MLLLAGAASSLVFYLSSRAITGIAPLRDGRLIGAALLFLLFFLWWEKRRRNPFIAPSLFTNGPFLRGTFCATMRMVSMGGIGFLIPLYLVDIKGIQPAELGGMLMIGAGSMAVVVRLAGSLQSTDGVVAGLSSSACWDKPARYSRSPTYPQALPYGISVWPSAHTACRLDSCLPRCTK